MYRYFALIFVLLAVVAAGQAPHLIQSDPVGANPSDAASVPFQLRFDSPVTGVTPGNITIGGTHAGTPIVTSASPEFGQALSLTSNIQRAIAAGLTMTPSATVEFWFRTNLPVHIDGVFSYATFTNSNEILFLVNGAFWTRSVDSGPNPGVNTGQWHHVALVVDSSETTYYLDGVLVATNPTPLASIISGGTLVLGDDQDNVGGGFESGQAHIGDIDELRIWSTLRSASEIANNRFAPIDASDPDLLHYWSFDSIEDLSAGAAGVNDIRDFVGTAHLDLVNGAGLSAGAPSARWIAKVDTSGITGNGTITLDAMIGGATSIDGTALVAHPGFGTMANALAFEPCTTPMTVFQKSGDPSLSLTPQVTVVFDQPVSGVTTSDFAVGGIAPGNAAITATTSNLGNALNMPLDSDYAQAFNYSMPFGGGGFTFESQFTATQPGACIASWSTGFSDNHFIVFASGVVFAGVSPGTQAIFPSAVLEDLNDGQWHHIAVTYDGASTWRRYVDGIPAGVAFVPTSLVLGSQGRLVLGQEQDAPGGGGFDPTQALKGAVDEVRIWATERTAAEIAANRNGTVDPASANLFTYYRCEELENLGLGGGLDDLRDFAGNAHMDTVGTPATDAAVPFSSEWNVDLSVSGATAFIGIDTDAGGSALNECGQGLISGPAATHVYVEDMILEVTINGGASLFHEGTASQGDIISMHFESPSGTWDLASTPLFLGQIFPGGVAAGATGAFPSARFDLPGTFSLTAPFTIFDGNSGGLFGTAALLPPGGMTIVTTIPFGLSGLSLSMQTLNITGASTNAFFAASNLVAIEVN